ncbi:MAG: cobalamin-dependent protein [Myxococcota bacterium]
MSRAPRRSRLPDALSPVLLLGAGAGEATCGILYLAGYLRRHGIEASVRLFDDDVTPAEVRRSLSRLMDHVRPRLVGLSLKWFHHLARARLVAEALKSIDPEVQVVLGGNSAAWWWKELAQWACVDQVVLGDGEEPLLALCRGVKDAPNVVARGPDGSPRRSPLRYVQGPESSDSYYSHFDELFLSGLDAHSFSGWIAPGKGCSENCLYCGGTRGVQQASFGRPTAFLRPEESVQKDHREVAPRTWQLRYDFQGSSAAYLERAWGGVDLSKHSATYFLWGVPPPGLIEKLASAFARVFLVLDIGCFSESQRLEQMKRGLLKPCPTDAQLASVIAECRRYANLELEVSGIAGLPFASLATLDEERRHVEAVLEAGCVVGYQRLEAQPGALVTEHPARFGMTTEARTFDEFLAYFSAQEPGDGRVPMVRFSDATLEAAVARTAVALEALAGARRDAKATRALSGRTRLESTAPMTKVVRLGDWLGAWQVPAKLREAPVTVVRSVDGHGLTCAPSVAPGRLPHAHLQAGDEGAAVLAVLGVFSQPTTVDAAVAELRAKARLPPAAARDLIEHLTAGRFLEPA